MVIRVVSKDGFATAFHQGKKMFLCSMKNGEDDVF